MASLRLITSSADIDPDVRRVYIESFPEEERRPWDDLCRLIDSVKTPYRFYAIVERGVDVGLLTTWEWEEAVYVEHFALKPTLRGRGVGGRVIDALRATSSRPVVLEAEPAELAPDARRRIGFYKRHGFKPVEDYRYMQPSYAPGLPEVELVIMTTGRIDVERLVKERLYREVYGVKDE